MAMNPHSTSGPAVRPNEQARGKRDPKKKSNDRKRADRPVWFGLGALLAIANTLIVLFGWAVGHATMGIMAMLLGAGAFSVGGLMGFLFGIPRVQAPEPSSLGGVATPDVTADRPTGPAETRTISDYRPSTNLEQVSDWLVKIIIGVGLVEFREVGDALSKVGGRVAAQFDPAPPGIAVLVQITIVLFAVLGFFAGYLWTRIDYGRVQVQADRSVRSLLLNLEERVSQQAEATKVLARDDLVRPGVTPAGRNEDHIDRALAPVEGNWPAEIQGKIQELRAAPNDWDSDPTGVLFKDGVSRANGRVLDAWIVSDLDDLLIISLRVRRTGGPPLTGAVTFLLHPSFPDRLVTVPVQGNEATVTIYAEEWFTIAAIADEGCTVLSYSLRSLPGAPHWFTEAD